MEYCPYAKDIAFKESSDTITLQGLGKLPFPEGTTLYIPQNCNIGDYCFYDDGKLPYYASRPSSLTGNRTIVRVIYNGKVIGDGAFEDCLCLSEIQMGNVVKIGKSAFFGCNHLIGSLTLPESVQQIEKGAFCNTCLKDIRVFQALLNNMNMTKEQFGKHVNHGQDGITIST